MQQNMNRSGFRQQMMSQGHPTIQQMGQSSQQFTNPNIIGAKGVQYVNPQYGPNIIQSNLTQSNYFPQPVKGFPNNIPYITQDMDPQYQAQKDLYKQLLKEDAQEKKKSQDVVKQIILIINIIILLTDQHNLYTKQTRQSIHFQNLLLLISHNLQYIYNRQEHTNIKQKVEQETNENTRSMDKSQEYERFQGRALITKTVNFSKQQGTKFYLLNQQLKQIRQSDEKFTDQEFQPTIQSISVDHKWHQDSGLKPKDVVWRRAQEIWKDKLTIVEAGINPNDIAQGQLGDCYFLSSLSVLAEKPQLIERLFEQFEVSPQGCYAVWLCVDGEWSNFILDDFIPCDKHHQPCFSRSLNGELWVLLMEKVYAKAFSCYSNIEAGITNYALKDLTGAPYAFLRNNKSTLDELWAYLFNNENKGYIQTASSQQDSQGDKAQDNKGIVYSHAYAILDVKQLKNNGKQLQLIKMRNPWGQGEWQGDWSDNSSLWTPELKKQVNFVSKNDGVFWIDVQDYQKEFSCTFVSYCNEKYVYAFEKIHLSQLATQKIGFTVSKSGHAFLQITQKCKRTFSQNHADYHFSHVKFIVFQEDSNGNVSKVLDGKYSEERDIHLEFANLKQGYYQAFISVDWNQKYSNDLVISTYSQQNIYFDKIASPIINQNLIEQILYRQPNPKQPTALSNSCTELLENFAGYVYMLFKNPSSKDKEFTVTPKTENLILMNPYERDQTVIKFLLRAQSAHIIKWKLDSKGKGSYNFSLQQSFTS